MVGLTHGKITNPEPNCLKTETHCGHGELHDYEGYWPKDCIQRAFVDGAKWWQAHHGGSTMFSSERDEAEKEAVRRYGEPS